MGGSLGPSLAAARVPVAAVDAPEDFGFWAPGSWGPPGDLAIPAFADVGRALAGARDPAVAQAARAAAFAGGVRKALAPFGKDGEPTYTPRAAYPSSSEERFPKRLAGLAAMLGAGLPIRCATLSAPGAWDTHADQATTLTENLTLTATSLYAFQRDLEARGIADRVLTLVWSEFGRRAAENGSGTDHGAAGIGFVIGTRTTGRMVGEFPGLTTLDEHGNLRATSDFRGLYASLTADWFGVDPASVLGGAAQRGAAEGRAMKRAALLALALALVATDVAAAAPARLLVEAREFNLTLSRGKIKHGVAIVQLANQGEDPHDLAIKRVGGKRRGGIAETRPGEQSEWEGRLRRGPLPALLHARGASRRGHARGPTGALSGDAARARRRGAL